jgi:hypothetical protein
VKASAPDHEEMREKSRPAVELSGLVCSVLSGHYVYFRARSRSQRTIKVTISLVKHNLQLVHTSDDGGYEDKLTGFAHFLAMCEKT